MQLPFFQTPDKTLTLLQTKWRSILNPVLALPTNSMSVLGPINLIVGTNVINHMLGQTLQGWFITDIDGAATIYRSAPFNDLTLTLHSSAAVTVMLGVF